MISLDEAARLLQAAAAKPGTFPARHRAVMDERWALRFRVDDPTGYELNEVVRDVQYDLVLEERDLIPTYDALTLAELLLEMVCHLTPAGSDATVKACQERVDTLRVEAGGSHRR